MLMGDRVRALMVPVLLAQGRGTQAIRAAREQTATLRLVTTRPECKATRAMAPQPQVMQAAVKEIQVLGLVPDLVLVRDQQAAESAHLAAAMVQVVAMVLEAPVELAAAAAPAVASDLAVVVPVAPVDLQAAVDLAVAVRVLELGAAPLAELASVGDRELLHRELLQRWRPQAQAHQVQLGRPVLEAPAPLQELRLPRRILLKSRIWSAIERRHPVISV